MSLDAPDRAQVRKKPSPARAAFGRLVLGHFIAYPVGFLAAMGAMPYAMILRERALNAAADGATSSIVKDVTRNMNLNPIEAAQMQILLDPKV